MRKVLACSYPTKLCFRLPVLIKRQPNKVGVTNPDQFYYASLINPSQQVNIMYEPSHREGGEFSEANLYEDLTEFIKIFKTIITTSESVSFLLAKSEQCWSGVRQLKEILSQDQNLINKYNYELDDLSPHRNTYFRFVWRILESLEIYKNRKYSVHPIFSIFSEFVNKTEMVINSYKANRNIGKLFKKIFNLANKFCNSCQIAINTGSHQEAAECFSKKQIQDKGGIDQNLELHVKKIHFNNSESNFHKVMGGLSRRFSTMSCLDLDYNSFKAIFFQTKNQKDELYKEMLQRNSFVYRQISLYSKQFQEYLKRREKQIIRKNRFKEGKSLGNTFSMGFKQQNQYNKSLDVTKILQTEKEQSPNIQGYEQLPQISPFMHSKRIKTKEIDLSDDRFLDFQKRKTSYQIKNVYLTLNKIHTNAEFNQSYLKNQRKNGKDKSKVYSLLKTNKYALKSTKFAQPQPVKVSRPILQIRQIEYKNMDMRLDQCGLIHQAYNSHQYETQHSIEKKIQRINTFQKRNNIRITQTLKKNSFNSKIKDLTILNEIQRIRFKNKILSNHVLFIDYNK